MLKRVLILGCLISTLAACGDSGDNDSNNNQPGDVVNTTPTPEPSSTPATNSVTPQPSSTPVTSNATPVPSPTASSVNKGPAPLW